MILTPDILPLFRDAILGALVLMLFVRALKRFWFF